VRLGPALAVRIPLQCGYRDADALREHQRVDVVPDEVAVQVHCDDITVLVISVSTAFSPNWHWIGEATGGICAAMKSANRIREHRERLGWSQERLAEAAVTSPQQVSRLENSQRRLSDGWLTRLSRAMGLRKSDLLVEDAFESGRPGPSDVVQDDIERRLLLFWRSLSAEAQDVVLDLVNTWARRRLQRPQSRRESQDFDDHVTAVGEFSPKR
jgi:transcriptional regulator with XRE-family HTH domain